MDIQIFHTVNSGLFLWDGKSGILVDGIHEGKTVGFSMMAEKWKNDLRHRTGLFQYTDGLLFTHYHPDHYEKVGVRRLTHSSNPPAFYAPGWSHGCRQIISLNAHMYHLTMGTAEIIAKDTLHDGEQFKNDRHQSFIICMNHTKLFIAGDAKLTLQDARDFQQKCHGNIDAAFVNLYQLTDPDAQECLRALHPSRIFLEHLPFKDDDQFHYGSLAKQVCHHPIPGLPQPEIITHMAWIDRTPAIFYEKERRHCL